MANPLLDHPVFKKAALSKGKLGTVCVLALCAVPLLMPEVAHATGSIRCGTKLVQRGMDRSMVEELCGKPSSIVKDGTVWFYEEGDSELRKEITFVNGTVEFIDEEGRLDEINSAVPDSGPYGSPDSEYRQELEQNEYEKSEYTETGSESEAEERLPSY